MAAEPLPLLVTTPHSSGEAPPEIFNRMRECGEAEPALRARIFSEGDPFTDRIYDFPAAAVVRASHSRFVVDLNRARDEDGPNGVIKLTDFQMRPLYGPDYRLTEAERERRLRDHYDPFHQAVESRLAAGGIRFLLDGHSMAAQGPVLGPDQGLSRPALCLGNFGDADGEPIGGPVSLDPECARAARDFARPRLRSAFPHWNPDRLVSLNDPFDGGHILRCYTHPAFRYRVPGLMFEINRALYLDEKKLEPFPGAIETWRSIVLETAGFILNRA